MLPAGPAAAGSRAGGGAGEGDGSRDGTFRGACTHARFLRAEETQRGFGDRQTDRT